MSAQIWSLKKLECLLFIVIKELFIFLDINPLWDIHIANILSQSVTCFSTFLNRIFWKAEVRVLILRYSLSFFPVVSVFCTLLKKLLLASLTIAKIWKWPKRPLTGEWIKKMWYMYMNFTQPLKKNETSPFVTAWMDRRVLC